MTAARAAAFAVLLLGCANAAPAPEASAPAAATSSTGPAAPSSAPAPASAAGVPSSTPASAASAASAPDAGAVDGGGSTGEERADNKVLPPNDSPDLQARAAALFDAVAHDDPARAEPFWFPKEPFIPLKDVKEPGRYWDQLHAAFARDIHTLHKKRPSWDGATFARFELGSTPKWVKPGEEANKIGYYRSFHGRLKYTAPDASTGDLDVHTVISWQGKWFITHLSKFK